jgi:hypothetical protein
MSMAAFVRTPTLHRALDTLRLQPSSKRSNSSIIMRCPGAHTDTLVYRRHQKSIPRLIKTGFGSPAQKKKHTTGGIPRWSPTLVLVARFSAYVWQSGRDAQFSLTYGRMCKCERQTLSCPQLLQGQHSRTWIKEVIDLVEGSKASRSQESLNVDQDFPLMRDRIKGHDNCSGPLVDCFRDGVTVLAPPRSEPLT